MTDNKITDLDALKENIAILTVSFCNYNDDAIKDYQARLPEGFSDYLNSIIEVAEAWTVIEQSRPELYANEGADWYELADDVAHDYITNYPCEPVGSINRAIAINIARHT